jgi:hypothetical protein
MTPSEVFHSAFGSSGADLATVRRAIEEHARKLLDGSIRTFHLSGLSCLLQSSLPEGFLDTSGIPTDQGFWVLNTPLSKPEDHVIASEGPYTELDYQRAIQFITNRLFSAIDVMTNNRERCVHLVSDLVCKRMEMISAHRLVCEARIMTYVKAQAHWSLCAQGRMIGSRSYHSLVEAVAALLVDADYDGVAYHTDSTTPLILSRKVIAGLLKGFQSSKVESATRNGLLMDEKLTCGRKSPVFEDVLLSGLMAQPDPTTHAVHAWLSQRSAEISPAADESSPLTGTQP